MKFTLLASVLAALLQTAPAIAFDAQADSAPPTKSAAGTTAEKDKCTLSGSVTNLQTGEPLKKVNLHLMIQGRGRVGVGNGQSTGYSGTSGPDGSFRFEAVEPGEYALSGERSGYIQTPYGSRNGITGGTLLNLQPGQQLTDLKLQLVPQAIISGRVIDDDGDPAGGVSVEAVGRMWGAGGKARYFPLGQSQTDDTGAFRIANLRPGKYYVAVQSRQRNMGIRETPATPGKPDIRPVRTFYPGSLDRAGASVLDLKPGQEVPGIEIRMRSVETFHIRGKLVGGVSENTGQLTTLMLIPQVSDGRSYMTGAGIVAKDQTFDIAGVAPGAYTISGPGYNGQQQIARQSVEVGSGDVNGIVVTTQSTFVLRGAVEWQGAPSGSSKEKGLENIQVLLTPDDEGIMMASTAFAMTKSDGAFVMDKVVPAKFRVRVVNQPEGAYIKSVRFGSQEALGKTLDLTQASGGEIHVILRDGAAEVSGTVQAKQEAGGNNGAAVAAVSSASILLIPEDTALNENTRSGRTNQNGAFTVKGVPPGTYYALAYELDDYRSFTDPALLKQLIAKGTKVEVRENDKKQAQLTLLPAEDLQAALAAAGGDN